MRASISTRGPSGTISIIGPPGAITPPTVTLRMFFTSPRTGEVSTVRRSTSARPAICSSICASSVCTRTSSLAASWRKRLTRSWLCSCKSLTWRRSRITSTSDIRPLADIASDTASSRLSSSMLRWFELTDSCSRRRRAWNDSVSTCTLVPSAITSFGKLSSRPPDSATSRAIVAFSARRLPWVSFCWAS